MGITGLLPFLERASRSCHIAEFRGSTVAVDSYSWLHKGVFGCAEKLIRGEDTQAYVQYCIKYIRMLRSYDITPIMVFDGKHLPAKKATEEARREKRKLAKRKAAELLRLGRVDEARSQMKLAIDVTHKMASALIKECRKLGIDCIVAPYEADAQLAYLSLKKIVRLVITEDSDLLLFGCSEIFVKMDIHGSGTLVDATKINNCMKLRHNSYNFNKFRYMCILSGCDYLASLPGIGLKKGLKFVNLTANPNIYDVLSKLPSYLKLSNLVVSDEYKLAFMIADATFQHQIIYDPIKRKLRPLTDPQRAGTKPEYCVNAGRFFDEDLAYQIALGNVDPLTNLKCDNWCPDKAGVASSSIWSRNYQKPCSIARKLPKLEAPPTRNLKVNMETDEEEQTEFDLKLDEVMEMYKVTAQTSRKRTIEIDVESTQTEPGPSTQTVNIPFKKVKQISKFHNTVIDTEQTCSSKFFPISPARSPPINIEESPMSPPKPGTGFSFEKYADPSLMLASETKHVFTEYNFERFAASKRQPPIIAPTPIKPVFTEFNFKKYVAPAKKPSLTLPSEPNLEKSDKKPKMVVDIKENILLAPARNSPRCPTHKKSDESQQQSEIETIVIDSDKSSQGFDSDVDRKSGNRFDKFATYNKDFFSKLRPVVTIASDSSEEELPEKVKKAVLMKGIRSALPGWNSGDSESTEENNNQVVIPDLIKKDADSPPEFISDPNVHREEIVEDSFEKEIDSLEEGQTSYVTEREIKPEQDNPPAVVQEDGSGSEKTYEDLPKLIRVIGDLENLVEPEGAELLDAIGEDETFDRHCFDSYKAFDEDLLPEGFPNFYNDKKDDDCDKLFPWNFEEDGVETSGRITSFHGDGNGSSSSEEAAVDITHEKLRRFHSKKSPIVTRSSRSRVRRKKQLSLTSMFTTMNKN